MEKVFEIGRQFRNKGVDFKHNPEFTSLEVYETYGDYATMRVLTQEIIQEAATAVYGSPVARRPTPTATSSSTTCPGMAGEDHLRRRSLRPSARRSPPTPRSGAASARRAIGLELDLDPSWGFVLEEIYGSLCEGTTTTPVFYTDFPKENSPLTRQHRATRGSPRSGTW